MRTWKRFWSRAGAAALVIALGGQVVGMEPAQAADVIENAYEATGSWSSVTTTTTADFTLFYPSNLGSGGFDHPVLTWGNGSGAAPSDYADLLEHLASWGFVVVASNSPVVGDGSELAAGVNYMIAQNNLIGGTFYQRLDVTKVGSLGHSQGAAGAINAIRRSPAGFIDSTAPIASPDPWTWCIGEPSPNICDQWGPPENWLDNFSAPVFFLRGENDEFSESEWWPTWYGVPDWYDTWFADVDGPAVRASRDACYHIACPTALGLVPLHVRMRGYVTAWFRYTLMNDTIAAGAFTGSSWEVGGNADWSQLGEPPQRKNLP